MNATSSMPQSDSDDRFGFGNSIRRWRRAVIVLTLLFFFTNGELTRGAVLDEAQALAQVGKFKDAIARLEPAIRAGGNNKPALIVALARIQVDAGLLISAQLTVERFVRETPKAPQANEMALLNAQLREAGGHLSEAVSLYRTIAEKSPPVPQRAEALASCVRVASLLRNKDVEELCLAEFTESFPKDDRAREFLLRLYRMRAARNDYRGAVESALAYQQAYPDDPAGTVMPAHVHLYQARDYEGAIAAFQAARKRPTFALNYNNVSYAIESMRRHTNGHALVEPLATEFARQTGDLYFEVYAMEILSGLNRDERAVALGKTLFPKLKGTESEVRVRLAYAYALSRLKRNDEAEGLLVEALKLEPSNTTAWDRYWSVVSALKRPEAHEALLLKTRAALASYKNLTLRETARSVIAYRLAQWAWYRKDQDAAAKFAREYLERDGLSDYGKQVVQIAVDHCFVGYAEARKAADTATAAAKKAKDAYAAARKSKKGIEKAKETADKAQAVASEALGKFTAMESECLAKFDSLLPALEIFLARTVPWGPAHLSIDDIVKKHLGDKPRSATGRKYSEMLKRARQNGDFKTFATFQKMRTARQWVKAAKSGQQLFPALMNAGGALGLEGGRDVIGMMYNAGLREPLIEVCKQYLAKYPGATAPLHHFAVTASRIGAPKNRELIGAIDAAVGRAGGSYWPLVSWGHVRGYMFDVAEQNRQPGVMESQLEYLLKAGVGTYGQFEFQRRIGAMQAATGEPAKARQTFMAAVKNARPMAAEAGTLATMVTSFTNSADWSMPLLDQYGVRPNRGPQHTGILLLKGHVLLTEKQDTNAAIKMVRMAAERATDLNWRPGGIPWQWGESLIQTVYRADVTNATSEEVTLVEDIVETLGPVQGHWMPTALLRQGFLKQGFKFSQTLNEITVRMNPNDGNWLANYYVKWGQQLASFDRPELAGLVLRAAMNRFTGADQKLRAQATQALFSLAGKHGFPAAEIDEKLEWAPLLKSALSFRMGDPVAAWNAFQANEALFVKHEDKVPADYLRWVSDRLHQRGDEDSLVMAERVLRRWIIRNENSKAVPDDEKAKTQLHIANYYFKTLRYDLARSECTSLLNRYPETPEATDAQFRIGECFLRQKIYVDAAKVFEQMAKSRDKLIASRAEFLLGVLAQERGDVDDAKERFRNVMDLAPSSDVADSILFRLSELYGQENRFRDELMLLRSIGLIGSSAKQWHTPGMALNIVIQDADLGVSRGQSHVPVEVKTSGGDCERVKLESGSAGKGFFRAELPTALGEPKPGDNILQVNGADIIAYDYPDDFKEQFSKAAPARSTIRVAADAEFRISSTEIKDEEEVGFEEQLRLRRERASRRVGTDYRQEFRRGTDIKPGNNVYLQVKDSDRDVSGEPDSIKVLVRAVSGGRVTTTLTETGPHTGVFQGTLRTMEIAANVFASDRSAGSDAVRAIDGSKTTAWEGLNDGRAPKYIVLDLKENVGIGRLDWNNGGYPRGKLPTSYAVQVSTNLTDWTAVAATTNYPGLTKAQSERIATTIAGRDVSATVNLTGSSGRYLRMFIRTFSGTAPRIAEITVTDSKGKVLLPSETDGESTGDVLRLTPSDRIVATYEDEISLVSIGKPRTMSQQLRATYYNGIIGFVAYEFRPVNGQTVPDALVKQVRRVDPGQRVVVSVTDYDADVSDDRDTVRFKLRASDGREMELKAKETEPFAGVFTKELDIWSPKRTNGFKLGPGVKLEAVFVDAQNTDPGAPIDRTANIELAVSGEAKLAVVPSTVALERNRNGDEVFSYASTLTTNAASVQPIKSVAFRAPLTFEIFDPAAAKDSFSEVTAVVTTSGGSSVEVTCPLSMFAAANVNRRVRQTEVDQALELGRFIGQVFMNLGDKDSPPTIVLEPGDTRTRLIARSRKPPENRGQEMANVVPVLNLNGRDIIKVSYQSQGTNFTDQARLAVPAVIEFTDNGYDAPLTNLYLGDKAFVVVTDLTADATPERDRVKVTIATPRGERFAAELQETLSHSGTFSGSFRLVAAEKPVPDDSTMEAWFGDPITLSYAGGAGETNVLKKTINVVKGDDGNLLVFQKKYATEMVAIESQFRMAEAWFELFKNYRELKQGPEATNALNSGMLLLKELRTDYPSRRYEARTDYLLGQFAQELGRYDEAITLYRRIVQNHSENPLAPDAQYKLGQCFEEKNDMDAASAEYVTLAYTWPDHPLVANVVVRIAEYFYVRKEYPTAAAVSKKFVDRFTQHEWAERMQFRTAQCWFKAENFQKAGEQFDFLIENFPRSKFRPDAMFWAGESYRSGRRLEDAYRRYKRTTWDYPESDAAKFARGKLVLPEMVNIAERDVAQ